MLFSRYKVAYEEKCKIMRNVASVAELKKSFFAETDKSRLTLRLPDIYNHVGPVKLFLNTLLSFHVKDFFLSFSSNHHVFLVLLDPCIDDHGSFVTFRSASIQLKHLFDPYFEP